MLTAPTELSWEAWTAAANADYLGNLVPQPLTGMPADSPRGAAGDMVPGMARGFTAYATGDYKRAASELEPLLDSHERLGGSRAQRDLLEYAVAAAKLRGGNKDEARAFIERRRPHNAKVGGFPLHGL